jgi:hypothetical protein
MSPKARPSSPTWNRAPGLGHVLNSVTGVLYLPASLVAGALWAVAPT